MSGVREQQRALRRGRMLKTARELFNSQGHERTTFNEIAARAGFGVATVYKYFPSKNDLIVALLKPDLERILEAGARVIENPGPDPAEATIALLRCYGDIGGRQWANREILRMTIFPGLGNDGILSDLVREAERRTQQQIAELLRALRQKGRVASSLRIPAATWVIFSLLNHHFGLYLADESQSFPKIFARLRTSVRTIFANWRTDC